MVHLQQLEQLSQRLGPQRVQRLPQVPLGGFHLNDPPLGGGSKRGRHKSGDDGFRRIDSSDSANVLILFQPATAVMLDGQ